MGSETAIDPNKFVHPVPIETRRKQALVGAYEILPRDTISDITLNEDMMEGITDPNLLQWFDKDFLAENAAIFSLGNPTGQRYVLQTPSSHRVGIVRKDAFFTDEHGKVFGEVGIKGSGITERSGPRRPAHTKDPQGFFGESDALREKEVTNLLAQEGGRVGRVIAHITLEPKTLGSWIKKNQSKDSTYQDPIGQMKKVLNNGDTPALLVRLQGTDRLEDVTFGQGYHDRANAMRRAARLLIREVELKGYESFLKTYGIKDPPFNLNKELEWLNSLSNSRRQHPTTDQLRSLFFLNDFFRFHNTELALRVSKKYFGGELHIKNATQDFDAAGFWYDFESSPPESPQHGHHDFDIQSIQIFNDYPRLKYWHQYGDKERDEITRLAERKFNERNQSQKHPLKILKKNRFLFLSKRPRGNS